MYMDRLSTDHTCVNIQTPGAPPVVLHVHGPSLYRRYMFKHTDTWGPSCHTSCTSLYRPYMCKHTDTWGPSCHTSCTSLYRPYMCKHTDTWGPSCHTSCTSLYRPYMCKHTDTWGPSCHTSCTSLYRPYMCKHTDTWGPCCHTSCTWSLYRPYMCKHTDTWGPSCHPLCKWTNLTDIGSSSVADPGPVVWWGGGCRGCPYRMKMKIKMPAQIFQFQKGTILPISLGGWGWGQLPPFHPPRSATDYSSYSSGSHQSMAFTCHFSYVSGVCARPLLSRDSQEFLSPAVSICVKVLAFPSQTK